MVNSARAADAVGMHEDRPSDFAVVLKQAEQLLVECERDIGSSKNLVDQTRMMPSSVRRATFYSQAV